MSLPVAILIITVTFYVIYLWLCLKLIDFLARRQEKR